MQRRIMAFVLVLCMLVTMLPVLAVGNDVRGHWAEEDITYLDERKIMEGYPDGSFKPDASIKKSEFITLINRTFGLSRRASINYSDVPTNAWYYSEIEKAEAAGYMFTFSKKVRPTLALTREEASAMFGKLLGLSSTASNSFTDGNTVSSWALPYVTAIAEENIIVGYPDSTFRPKNSISRAQVARILKNIIGNYYNEAGTYTDTVSGNATVVTGGVTLSNMVIPGNLYITEGVGYGTVTLNNVVVLGEVLTVGVPNATLVLQGTTTAVNVATNGIGIQVASSINSLKLSGTRSATAVTIYADATIGVLTCDGPATVGGSGSIKKAVINANGVSIAKSPEQWTIKSGVSATIAGTVTSTSGSVVSDFVEGYPKATASTSVYGNSTIEIKAKLLKASNLYAIAVLAGSTAPTAQQIKAMQSYQGGTVLRSNMAQVINVANEVTISLSTLPTAQSYDLWLVTEDLINGALGTPVKVNPEVPVFASGYPLLQSTTTSELTIAVKATRATTLYWVAVPKTVSTTAPTAAEIVAQTANVANGYIYNKRQLFANYEDFVAITGLPLGATAYDIYVVTADESGAVSPATPVKLSPSTLTNTMTVTYTLPANTDNEYPAQTPITLTFSKDMYKKNSSMLMSFLSTSVKDCMKIEKKDIVTGVSTETTDFSVYVTNNKELIIVPSQSGWASASIYTVTVDGLTSADGAVPTPDSFSFATVGAGKVIIPPIASSSSGNTVVPGEKITLTTTAANATIQYTTNGADPISGTYTAGSATGTDVTVPLNLPSGVPFLIRAVTKVNGQYSTIAEFTYYVAYNAMVPQFKTASGELLADGVSMMPGSSVYLTCSDANAQIYYTTDGTDPSFTSASVSGSKLTQILLQGAAGSTFVIRAVAVKNGASSDVVSFTVNLTQDGTSAKPLKPVFYYGGTALDTTTLHPVSRSSSLTIASVGSLGNVRIRYTIDDTDPITSSTAIVSGSSAVNINLAAFGIGSVVKIRAVAENTGTTFGADSFSEAAYINLYIL